MRKQTDVPTSDGRQRQHGRPPRVQAPTTGDSKLDAGVARYAQLYARWQDAAEQALRLTRQPERAEGQDDVHFAELVRLGRAEPTKRPATEKVMRELTETTLAAKGSA